MGFNLSLYESYELDRDLKQFPTTQNFRNFFGKRCLASANNSSSDEKPKTAHFVMSSFGKHFEYQNNKIQKVFAYVKDFDHNINK